MQQQIFDIIVIGSGSGGLTAAFWLAGAGKKVAIVEKWMIGGDCTNFWCIPSKAFIDIAKKWQYNSISEVLSEVRKRRQVIRDEETPELFQKHWIAFFAWTASFQSKDTILVNDEQKLQAKHIVISTGSHPNMIEIEWVDQRSILTNEQIFELTDDVKKLVVIGGGYIGCELAESFANAGVQVTLVQRNTRLVPHEEPEVSEALYTHLSDKWIKIFLNATLSHWNNKEVEIIDSVTQKQTKIPFDNILISLGRSANISQLHLEWAGIISDKKGIVVDSLNRTNIKNIFAIGDCVSGNPQFTHWANNEWRGVVKNILVPKILRSSVRNTLLPSVLYTTQEVARIGKTKQQLLTYFDEQDIITKKIDFSANDRSRVTDDTNGFILIHFKRVSGKILWATVMWTGAGEIIAPLVTAMQNKISAYTLSKQIFAYPTKSEVIKKICDQFVVHTLWHIKDEGKYFLKDNILQIATAIIWITLLTLFFRYKTEYNLSIEQIAINIYNFISGNPTLGPLIYIVFYAIRPIVFFPATLMTFMSGALFGPWLGIAFTLIGENMSAAFAYFLWGVFGKKIISPDSSAGIVNNLKNKANKKPFMSILMTRLLFFPFDMVNYISGLLRIKFIPFVLATFIWIIPGASVFVIAGAAFHGEELTSFSDAIANIDITLLYGAAGLFVATLVLAKILKKLQK